MKNLFTRVSATCILLLISALSLFAQSGYWTDEGNYDISWYDKNQDEFHITTAKQLAGLAYLTNSEIGIADRNDYSIHNKVFYLDADIDLSAHYWIPIYTCIAKKYVTSDHDIFDGQKHTVDGMKINLTEGNQDVYTRNLLHVSLSIGLFGEWEEVKNITMGDHCDVYVGETKLVQNARDLPVGVLGGKVTTVVSCVNNGVLTVEKAWLCDSSLPAGAGGLVGCCSKMIDCVNNADIRVAFNHGNAGGLCAVGDVYNCVNRGMVQHQLKDQEIGYSFYIGGLAGRGSVVNSVNQGSVDSRCIGLWGGSNGARVSGLASSSSILNSCNQGDVSIFSKNCATGFLSSLSANYSFEKPVIANSYTSGKLNWVSAGDDSFSVFEIPASEYLNKVYYGFGSENQRATEDIIPIKDMKDKGFLDILNANLEWLDKTEYKHPEGGEYDKSIPFRKWVMGVNGLPEPTGEEYHGSTSEPPTGIHNVSSETESANKGIYDLMGRRITKLPAGKIGIRNGKKYIGR
ncbi:hypothetical protein ACTQ3T_11685 [Segatella copri]|uniref:hypothetical protein n=1 Tax=Segatella copri TaxID=165179 RepID=UPI003F95856B